MKFDYFNADQIKLYYLCVILYLYFMYIIDILFIRK